MVVDTFTTTLEYTHFSELKNERFSSNTPKSKIKVRENTTVNLDNSMSAATINALIAHSRKT